ncbi:actin-like ATPase domain-containing protein [Aspergillus sclerotioniger CBS 115572]|uniref:Actin-like ATPase domain-containing protein n=1 Tax=Aspergillus sclerotioniger CBS 115572 TaxID=1450535 RepID=A0A317X9Z4_9EURO|nr:actin-like ATPase domain-containing protein [Aspergillus sclerotioniger CBS 115572]PWY95394.1 actin-like ATPase domain-containing protein [Aspergillus sclerotioniger CBS 115572]
MAPSIVVGLDFGTTFSGYVIAWAFKGSTDNIEVMSTWPGGGNRKSVKVPSILSYGTQSPTWGYQVRAFTEALRGIKLLLDEDQETTYSPSLVSKELLKKYKKDAVQVTADFMRHLIRHAEEVLERRLGIPAKAIDKRFTLTVPAVWSDKAKHRTLQAAEKAGISLEEISLVSEPEAAALYSLRATQPNSIAKNDVLIVCDAGGGTVDLISYQITELEPLALMEVVKGAGRICGSMILDQRFEHMLEEKMGPSGYGALSDVSRESIISYWQGQVKSNYVGKYDDEYVDVDYFIPVPGARDDPSIPIEGGLFYLSSDDIESIFEPVLRDVELLVAEQMEGIQKSKLTPKAIILVGGFGSSNLLFHRLQEANPTVTVLQPPDAWSAVVSGAVYRGLDGNRVESRIARRHYGVEYSTPYIEGKHNPDDKVWHELEEEYFVHRRMKWHIHKFSKLSENNPIKIPFYRTLRSTSVDAYGLLFNDGLLFCQNDIAPDIKNDETIPLCSLEADLSKIPRELFEKLSNSKGVEYFKINFDLVLIPTSASLLFELEFNGVPYGSVRSKY